MNKSNSFYWSLLLKCIILPILYLLPAVGHSQNGERKPEAELAMGINVVTGTIQYGSNKYYITDRGSAAIGLNFRYDHPVKVSGSRPVSRYICWTAQAGFLFGKAKMFDSTYFHPKAPSYMPVSIGIYNRSALSIGAEIFFWKGLGTRDIWGFKYLSIGYNAGKFRVNASVQRYMQVMTIKNGGTVLGFDFLWKLIR